MIVNKEEYRKNKALYTILTALEVAITKQDSFSASILITRLNQFNVSLEGTNVSDNNKGNTTKKSIPRKSSSKGSKAEYYL